MRTSIHALRATLITHAAPRAAQDIRAHTFENRSCHGAESHPVGE